MQCLLALIVALFIAVPALAATVETGQQTEGQGSPGNPAGGVLTVQGDPSGTPLPVTAAFPAPPVVLSWLFDGTGHPITSQVSGSQRPLDTATIVAGIVVDPRARTWNLSASDVPLVSQGTAAALVGAWPVKLTDGTNTAPTMDSTARPGFQKITDGTTVVDVKPGNTAAAAADKALVVALSPTSSIGTGTNIIGGVNQGNANDAAHAWTTKLTAGSDIVAVKPASTGISALDPALVVGISPNTGLPAGNNRLGAIQIRDGSDSPFVKGQTTMSNSLPVVVASDNGLATAVGQSATQPRNITQIGGAALALGQAAAANSIPVVTQADALPATQNITVVDSATTTTLNANFQAFMTGTPTAGSTASFALSSFESIEVMATGTWTGTLQSEISMDGGTTWFTRGVKQAGVVNISSSFTSNFGGGLNFAGMTNYRLRATSAMTGTATVRVVATTHPASVTVTNPEVEAGRGVLSTFTKDYSAGNLTTGAFVTVIASTGSIINEEDIFDTSGLDYYLAYAATCGALSNAANAVIVSPSGGIKDFQIPTGQCVGIEAKTATISAGSVNMTFYK